MENTEKSAFSSDSSGMYEYNRMSIGLLNTPAALLRPI